MSLLEPKTIPMFYFTGDKATTPSCPIDLQPDMNPSSGAQSYSGSNVDCTLSAKYNIPFFLDNLGPKFQEWSVNAHEARPGHHTQVIHIISKRSKGLFTGGHLRGILSYSERPQIYLQIKGNLKTNAY